MAIGKILSSKVFDNNKKIKLQFNKEKIAAKKLENEETLNLIERNLNKHSNDTTYLSSEVLLKAPKNFFNKYDKYVKKTVLAIQNTLSNENRSSLIINAKKHPTDSTVQRNTFMDLASEFLKYTENDPAGELMIKQFNKTEVEVLKALVINELIGLGPLQPLWNDTSITEIICNGPYDIQVEIQGNIQKVDSCHFRDADHLQKLITVLYTSINKDITVTNPMERGRLSDNSRMMAVHQSVAPDGPNFNIRRHSEDYWGPDKIISTGEANEELMTYLGNLIYDGVSFLVIGGTGTGKTTLLDALTAYYRPNERIVTLEDNLEMKPHPRKLIAAPMECIPAKPGSNNAGITMRDLVHASLQMRPEAIIIGEVTDGAAYDLCQALNTGHSGASTVHANNASEAIYRVAGLASQSKLIDERGAYDQIAAAFDIIITIERFPADGARRITEISEVGDKVIRDDEGNHIVPVKPLWKYYPDKEAYQNEHKTRGVWKQVGQLSDFTIQKHYLNLKKKLTWEQLKEIAKL